MTSSNIIKIPIFLKRIEAMKFNSCKNLKCFFIVLAVFLLVLAAMGQVKIASLGTTAGAAGDLDEISRKQVDYFLEIAENVEIINRMDFFRPYNEAAKRQISHLLENAAALEPDECGKQYLLSLSYRITQDTFYSLTPDWFSLEKNKAEIIFLPGETHGFQELWLKSFFFFSLRDWRLFHFQDGAKTAETSDTLTAAATPRIFDTFVYINDTAETQRFQEYRQWFDRMLDNVPQKTKEKIVPFKPEGPSIKIAYLVYGSQPDRISIVYPDREVFNQDNRFKIIVFKNSVDAYVECFLKPIAGKILEEDPQRPVVVDSESYLSNLVMHKMAHQMGPVFTLQAQGGVLDKTKAGKNEMPSGVKKDTGPGNTMNKVQLKLVSETLGDLFIVSEELKAGVLAIHNTSVLIEQGLIPKALEINIYATYLVSLVDRIRKGSMGPLFRTYLVQFNYLLKNEAIRFNVTTQKISIDLLALPKVLDDLAGLVVQRYNSPGFFFKDYGQLSPEIVSILENLKDVPGDAGSDVKPEPGLQPEVR
jgi:hypothetical protein